jgi:hypothetical protein
MRLKRRVLPDFETASLLLFALLVAGAAGAGARQGTRQTDASQGVTSGRAAVLQQLPPAPAER